MTRRERVKIERKILETAVNDRQIGTPVKAQYWNSLPRLKGHIIHTVQPFVRQCPYYEDNAKIVKRSPLSCIREHCSYTLHLHPYSLNFRQIVNKHVYITRVVPCKLKHRMKHFPGSGVLLEAIWWLMTVITCQFAVLKSGSVAPPPGEFRGVAVVVGCPARDILRRAGRGLSSPSLERHWGGIPW